MQKKEVIEVTDAEVEDRVRLVAQALTRDLPLHFKNEALQQLSHNMIIYDKEQSETGLAMRREAQLLGSDD